MICFDSQGDATSVNRLYSSIRKTGLLGFGHSSVFLFFFFFALMNINGSICKSVSDKWELFDSERDMADIGDEYFALESLDNNQNALN